MGFSRHAAQHQKPTLGSRIRGLSGEQHVCLNTTRHGKERAENHLERRQLVVSKLLKLIKLLQERVDESQ